MRLGGRLSDSLLGVRIAIFPTLLVLLVLLTSAL